MWEQTMHTENTEYAFNLQYSIEKKIEEANARSDENGRRRKNARCIWKNVYFCFYFVFFVHSKIISSSKRTALQYDTG